jgi:hypothetical protein
MCIPYINSVGIEGGAYKLILANKGGGGGYDMAKIMLKSLMDSL